MTSTPSPPPAPDPVATANAQGISNRDTAITQARLNSTNQVTPQGSLTYTAGPEVNGVPQYTATTTLSPEQQRIYDLQTSSQEKLGRVGNEQIDRVSGILNTPFDLKAATDAQYKDFTKTLLDPTWNARAEQFQNNLYNKGIRDPNSQAYQDAMRGFDSSRDTAYDQFQLDSLGQARQAALTERNQPLNEISALTSGSQVSMPSFASTPQTAVSPTNVLGAYDSANQANQFNYGQQMQSNNATMGGLFGLGSAGVMGGVMLL